MGGMEIIKTLYKFLFDTKEDWALLQPSRLAAAIAYRGIFSLVPLLLISILIVSLVFDLQTAIKQMNEVLTQIVGAQTANIIEAAMTESATEPNRLQAISVKDSLIVGLIGVGVLLYGATALFTELKLALNTVWGIPYAASRGIWRFIYNRLIALAMAVGVGLLFLSTVIANTIISVINSIFPLGNLVQLISLGITFSLLTLLIALIYRYAPDISIAWRDVWVGSVVTALLLTVGIYLIGIYLAYSHIGSAFGAAGALMVILIWMYYSAHIFIIGASFTRSFALRIGPKKMATLVTSKTNPPANEN